MSTIRLSGTYFPGVELLSGIGTAIILYFGSTRVLDQEVSVGVMVAFVGYLSSFFDPIQQLSQLYNTFQSAMAALEKIFGVLDTEPEIVDAPGAVDLPRIEGRIELRGVSFALRPHAGAHRPRPDDPRRARPWRWSARPAPASRRSPSWSRASTTRVEGQVLIDGHDLREVTMRSLRDQLAIVPQEGHLFAGTVAENLAFGRPEATDEELRAAADAVGATGFIEALPDGFDTRINEQGLGPLGRPAPADLLRPGAGRRPAAADPRRGHLVGRPARRAADRGRAARPAGGPHRDHHRPPPLDDPRRRPHRGARGRGASWSRARTTSWSSWAAATRRSTATGPRPRADLSARPHPALGRARARRGLVRSPAARPVVGDRLAVGRRVLAPVAGVRILLPQSPSGSWSIGRSVAHSSRGLGRRPLTAVTRVQIPYALLNVGQRKPCSGGVFCCAGSNPAARTRSAPMCPPARPGRSRGPRWRSRRGCARRASPSAWRCGS